MQFRQKRRRSFPAGSHSICLPLGAHRLDNIVVGAGERIPPHGGGCPDPEVGVIADLSIESGSQIASVSALRIISWCPELRVCRLEVHDKPDDDGGGPQPVLTHTFLHTFDLNCAGTLHPMIHRFFSYIYFPELRHFTLRGSCESEEHLSFAPLLAAVPYLESLDIGIEALPKSCLVELFHGLPPTMSRLHIFDVPHSRTESHNNILALLTLFPTSFTLCCPSLNELRITDCMGFSDIGLLNLIKSRMEISSHEAGSNGLNLCSSGRWSLISFQICNHSLRWVFISN